MNIICESCDTRYTISDEKVTGEGRVFKVNCKQCQASIMVDGIAEGSAPEPAVAAWYYALDQDRHGPLNPSELVALVRQATVTPDTHVWKEGMADWLLLKDVPELSEAIAAEPAEPAAEPGEPVAEPGEPAAAEPLATPAASDAAEPAPSAEDLFSFDSVQKEPRGTVHGRRDSSVLFSLDELSSFQATPTDESDAFLTETSGLIDIRGLANSHRTQAADSDNPFLNATAGLSTGLSKPSFSLSSVPVVTRKKSVMPWVLGLAGLLVVALSIGLVMALVADETSVPVAPTVVPVAPTVESPAQPPEPIAAKPVAKVASTTLVLPASAPKPAVSSPPETDGPAASTETTPSAPKKVVASPSVAKATEVAKKTASRRTDRAAARKASLKRARDRVEKPKVPGRKPPERVTKTPTPKPPVEKAANSKGVNDLLSSLSGAKKPAKVSLKVGKATGPRTLSSSTVFSKLGAKKGRFKACYRMQPNRPADGVNVTLTFTVASSGKVSSARVRGGGLTGSVQGCMIRTLKGIRFPAFREPMYKGRYPLFLR